ncbi:hypothetical protein Tco_0152328, partial [Tanacetum coccineum]
MSKVATWQAVIEQPPPHGRSGTHMPRVSHVAATCQPCGADVELAKTLQGQFQTRDDGVDTQREPLLPTELGS